VPKIKNSARANSMHFFEPIFTLKLSVALRYDPFCHTDDTSILA